MKPVLCMITAGRHAAGSDDGPLVRAVEAAARAGAHLIQIREHGIDAGHLARVVRACLRAVAGSSARIVVSDRLDVALATGAHGVHLREASVPPGDARAAAPRGFLIGRSVHTAADTAVLGRDGALDYLIFGAVFPTPGKSDPPAGVETLRLAVQATTVPVLAVGGVDGSTAAAVAASGAAGIAAIRWWSAMPVAALAGAARELADDFAAASASRR